MPLKRPAWWYDPDVAGEGIADVGTHLADLAMWLMFPDQPIDHRHDVTVLDAARWPTHMDRESFRDNTGLADFPVGLAHLRDGDFLQYWGNGSVNYRLRDRHVRLTTRWGVRAEGPEGDTHLCIARGSRCTVTVCHEAKFGLGPQVVVVPNIKRDQSDVLRRIELMCAKHAGYSAVELGNRVRIQIPDSARTGHESHFASVLTQFIEFFQDRSRVPAWEQSTMLAMYFVTTEAVRARIDSR